MKAYKCTWTEYEHDGWATQRDDGISIHASREEAEKYLEEEHKKGSYGLFWRGSWPPEEINFDGTKEQLKKLKEGKCLRFFPGDYEKSESYKSK